MPRYLPSRALLILPCGWLLVLACGSRTGLPPGQVVPAEAGAPSFAGAPPQPMCLTAMDCPQPPPGQCGLATCDSGVCSLSMGQVCDDKDPCTVDSCVMGGCVFTDGRVDADADGVFATGTSADPKAPLGCGKETATTRSRASFQARPSCVTASNELQRIVDDGTLLQPSALGPDTRVPSTRSTRRPPAWLSTASLSAPP